MKVNSQVRHAEPRRPHDKGYYKSEERGWVASLPRFYAYVHEAQPLRCQLNSDDLLMLAFYDPLEKVEDIGAFEHKDPGHRADPTFPNLLKAATKIYDLSPSVGTEISGVQLSQLTSDGLDELALLAAERGALVFRSQDFADIGFAAQKRIVSHFGPLHIHGWAPHPMAGSHEHMIIYDHASDLRVRKSWKGRSPIQWHTDQSPEQQPPGTTFICMLESPAQAGGDTLISSSVAAFKALSPRFRKRLEGLQAVHSNNDGVQQEMKNGEQAVMRRQQLEAVHPVVRLHPVTGEKALCTFESLSCASVLTSIRRQPSVHQAHRRLRSRGIRLPPRLPVRPHCEASRLPMSSPLRSWDSARLGPEGHEPLANARLSSWRKTSCVQIDPTCRKTHTINDRRR